MDSRDEVPRFLTVRQFARALGISVALAYRLISDGQIEHLRVGVAGGLIRIPESEVDRYLRENEQ